MKLVVVVMVAVVVATGCGEGDPNKNLPPVNPNAKLESAGEAGAGKGGMKAPGMVKN